MKAGALGRATHGMDPMGRYLTGPRPARGTASIGCGKANAVKWALVVADLRQTVAASARLLARGRDSRAPFSARRSGWIHPCCSR